MQRKLNTMFFLMGYFIYLFAFYMFYASNLNKVIPVSMMYHYAIYVSGAALVLSCFFIVWTSKKILVSLILFVSAVIYFLRTHDNTILITSLIIISGQQINYKDFFSKDIIVRCIIVLTVVLLCLFKIIPDTTSVRDDGSMRWALGFAQPNTTAAILLSIIAEWIILKNGKLQLRHYGVLFVMLVVINNITNSRSTAVGLIVIIISCFFLGKQSKSLSLPVRLTFICLYPIFAITDYLIAKNYNYNGILLKLNNLFSGRISLIHYFTEHFDITFWGQYIPTRDPNNLKNTYYLVVDNSYISILLKYGLIFLIVFGILYMMFINRVIAERSIGLIAISIAFLAIANMENTLYIPAYNVILPFLISIPFGEGSYENKTKDKKK